MAMTDTEKASTYDHLEQMTTEEILLGINAEDVSVPLAVGESIPQIKELVDGIVERMKRGGRVFYIGAPAKALRHLGKGCTCSGSLAVVRVVMRVSGDCIHYERSFR